MQIRFGEPDVPRKHWLFTDTSYNVLDNAVSATTLTFELPFDVQFDEVHKSEATMLGLSKDTIVDVLEASVCMAVDVRKRDDPQIVFGTKKQQFKCALRGQRQWLPSASSRALVFARRTKRMGTTCLPMA